MRNHLRLLLLFLFTGGIWIGCGDDSKGDDGDISGGIACGADCDATGNGGEGEDGLWGGMDDIATDGAGNDGDFVACETLSSDLSRVATRVMLLQDISSSMSEQVGANGQSKWELAQTAIEGMVNAYDSDIEFGLDLFPRGGSCNVGSSVILDVAPDNASAINNELAETNLSQTTPLLRAMVNYTQAAYAPGFLDGGGGSYLVIISDGADSCGANGQFQQGASAAELQAVTANLRNLFGIRTIVIGFGQGVEPAQLNAIAQAGGTSFNTYLKADDGEQLSNALSQIAEKVVASCVFQVGTFENPDVNFDWVVVSLDGKKLGYDPGCEKGKGWTWTSDAHSSIEFCAEKCADIEDGNISSIKVELACSADDVPPEIE